MTKGVPTDLSVVPPICEHCILSKQARNPVPRVWEGERAKAPLEIIYSDLTGPEDVPTPGGSIYLMNIINDYSSFPWGFILKKKSDAEQVFQDWKTKVECETGHRIGIVRTDGGGEYSSSTFKAMLQQQGIEHQTTAPYTSAQNGKSQHMHQTIMGQARLPEPCVLMQNYSQLCGVSALWWPFTWCNALPLIHLQERHPSKPSMGENLMYHTCVSMAAELLCSHNTEQT